MTEGEMKGSRLGAILRATSGNFLEQFDFFLFGFYATAISRAFFPSDNEVTSLMLTFTTFWLGALMRPVGAIVLGSYLDRIGRRQGLIVTLAIMAAGTVLIAATPTYAQIGVMAPIIVLAGRLLQGFSAGVELGGVSVYLFEISTPGNRGFYTSFQSGSQQIAIVVAALLGYGLSVNISPAIMGDWGWRIPFVVGCAIVPFIFLIRRNLEETPVFLARKVHPTSTQVLQSVVQNWRIVLLGMLLVAMTTVTFYFTTVYAPTFGRTVLKLGQSDALFVTLCAAVTNFFWLPIGGALSDRIGRRPVLLAVAGFTFLIAYPLLTWLVDGPTVTKLLLAMLTLSFCFGVYSGAMVAALTEIVPTHVRTTCFSFAYSMAAALFGTFTPLAATWLIDQTGNRASPGFWLMAAAAASFAATIAIYQAAPRLMEARAR